MKKIITAISLIAIMILCSTNVFAEHYWNDGIKFTAAYGTVEINGDGSGWDDAQPINMALNNDPLAARGYVNYQGGWADDRDDKDYSGTYKVKWDENYIYFLEDRNDNYVNLNGDGEQPYFTDGTLIFTQVDSPDGKMNPAGISVHAFYTVGNGSGAIGGDLKARVCNIEDISRETVDIPGGKIASSLKSGGFIIELAIPWSFYSSLSPNFKGPSAGDIMGLSYVVHDSDEVDPGFEKQFCYAVDNDMLGDVPGGYDFGGWGVLELLAPVAAPEPEPAPEPEAAAPAPAEPEAPAPAPVRPAAPATGDSGILVIFALMVCAAGVSVLAKRAIKSK